MEHVPCSNTLHCLYLPYRDQGEKKGTVNDRFFSLKSHHHYPPRVLFPTLQLAVTSLQLLRIVLTQISAWIVGSSPSPPKGSQCSGQSN